MVTSRLQEQLRHSIQESEFPNYIYGYPPKRAFRPFERPRDLRDIWGNKEGDLNVYIHIPFCNYRCSFCTLFLTTAQTPDLVEAYVQALENQIARNGELIGHMRLASVYIGGGTPTVLSDEQFSRLFECLFRHFPRAVEGLEISVEGSPDTMTAGKVKCLTSLGVNRISMGIQSFNEEEMMRAGRRYGVDVAVQAIENIRSSAVEHFNLDLIYGLEGQDEGTWSYSLGRTLAFEPTTLTIYPVVFRPLTGIMKIQSHNPDRFLANQSRYALYDYSVAELQRRGYQQESLVRFTRFSAGGYRQEASDFQGVPLLGLGAGARSYCGQTHYTTDYAVGRKSTLEIISHYINRVRESPYEVIYGICLESEELQRRYIILNLLLNQLSLAAFERRFAADPRQLFGEELQALAGEECINLGENGDTTLTPKGFKYSNLVGALFYSLQVKELEASYVPK